MKYLTLNDYHQIIFNDIYKISYDDKTKTIYQNYTASIKKLGSILEFVKNNTYYPNYFSKVAYLFTSISTGHLFPNGNKRLALVSYIHFALKNNYSHKPLTIKSYKKWFSQYLPKYKLTRNFFKTNFGWALYNLNKAINVKTSENSTGHNYSFEELKKITAIFFCFISKK